MPRVIIINKKGGEATKFDRSRLYLCLLRRLNLIDRNLIIGVLLFYPDVQAKYKIIFNSTDTNSRMKLKLALLSQVVGDRKLSL